MNEGEHIFTILVGDAAVFAIIGDRVYPSIDKPQNITYPAVTYMRVGSQPQINLTDRSGVDVPLVQIDCWHQTYSGVRELAAEVRRALTSADNIAAIFTNDNDFLESGADPVRRVSSDFTLWE